MNVVIQSWCLVGFIMSQKNQHTIWHRRQIAAQERPSIKSDSLAEPRGEPRIGKSCNL